MDTEKANCHFMFCCRAPCFSKYALKVLASSPEAVRFIKTLVAKYGLMGRLMEAWLAGSCHHGVVVYINGAFNPVPR